MNLPNRTNFPGREVLEGKAAGLGSSGHLSHLGRNRIKAASVHFPQGTVIGRGRITPGQNEHRSGNPIEAAHFFFFGGATFGRRMTAARMVASAVMALPVSVGSICITGEETQGGMSKVNAGGARS
jgi:hypothetical protein